MLAIILQVSGFHWPPRGRRYHEAIREGEQ